jgi:hypothetical protein
MRRDACTPSPIAHFHGADYGNLARIQSSAVKDVELDKYDKEQGKDNDGS